MVLLLTGFPAAVYWLPHKHDLLIFFSVRHETPTALPTATFITVLLGSHGCCGVHVWPQGTKDKEQAFPTLLLTVWRRKLPAAGLPLPAGLQHSDCPLQLYSQRTFLLRQTCEVIWQETAASASVELLVLQPLRL